MAATGDVPTLNGARQSISIAFRDKANLSDPEIQPAIQHAEDLAKFLKTNLVQGKKNDEGVYSPSPLLFVPWVHNRLLSLQNFGYIRTLSEATMIR